MNSSPLYRLRKEDIPRAVECLKDAFQEDPLWRVVFKDDPDRDKALTAFYTCPLLYGMKYGKACATSPDMEGVAVWVPGRYANMSMWGMWRSGALRYGMAMGRETTRNLAIVSKELGPEKKRIMKSQPYIYLTIIGVSSSAQGKGLGSKMMEAIKEECSRDGLHIYLETEVEDNIQFYERHGLSVQKKVVLSKLNVPMWLMAGKP